MVFKLYFLDIDEVEYIFICLIAIWNFSFVKYRFKFFAHLKIELLFFLLMYVYILSMNHLLDICTAHMLFPSLVCLFTCFLVSLDQKKFLNEMYLVFKYFHLFLVLFLKSFFFFN